MTEVPPRCSLIRVRVQFRPVRLCALPIILRGAFILKRWQFWLGLAVSAVFLLWALQGLDLQQVAQYLKRGNYLWLIPSVGVYFLAVLVRTWRWDYLLRPLKRIPVKRLFPVVVIGYMGNNIFPFRVGELLRAYVLKRNEQVSISSSLATIVVERIFDGLTMLLFVFVALPTLPTLPDSLRAIIVLGGVLFLQGEPPGLTLMPELRAEFGAALAAAGEGSF